MIKQIIMFGAGDISNAFSNIAKNLSVEVLFYVDNCSEKWGIPHMGKEIAPPETLFEWNEPILISCADIKPIVQQITKMGIKNRILSLWDLIKENLSCENLYNNSIFGEDNICEDNQYKDQWTIIIDNFSGSWGGSEEWSHMLAEGLRAKGHVTSMIEKRSQSSYDNKVLDITEYIKDDLSWNEHHIHILRKLCRRLPFVLVDNRSRDILYCALILKARYPAMVKIISVLHGDSEMIYKCHSMWDEVIDTYHCVSTKIKEKLKQEYKICAPKVMYSPSPIFYDTDFEKEYSAVSHAPLSLGVASRLDKEYKRADLLPSLISELERMKCNYKLYIAGQGDCEEEIRSFVSDKKLDDKVIFHGLIHRNQMCDYWKRQDVYLNFSDSEGCSLAMMEAMSYGLVPVVTHVSGVDDFVMNEHNGFIVDVNDIENMVKNICVLDKNRYLLKNFGQRCREVIKNKCDKNRFLEYFENLIDNLIYEI